jgi:hypothetical protein
MSSEVKEVIKGMSKSERRELTLAYQEPHILVRTGKNSNFKNRYALPIHRLELISAVQGLFSDRDMADQLSELENGSLALIIMGFDSTGIVNPELLDALGKRSIMRLYAARGAYEDSRIPPKIQIAPWRELYGLSMRYIDKGGQCLKEFQPTISWKPTGATETIPNTPDYNIKAGFWDFLKDSSRGCTPSK